MTTEVEVTGGYLTTDEGMEYTIVICRFTKERKGETLSLESDGISIAVRFEDVEKIVKKVRNK